MPAPLSGLIIGRQANVTDTVTGTTPVAIGLNDLAGSPLSIIPADGVEYIVAPQAALVNSSPDSDFGECRVQFGSTVMTRQRSNSTFSDGRTNIGRGHNVRSFFVVTGDGSTALQAFVVGESAAVDVDIGSLSIPLIPTSHLLDLHRQESANGDTAITTPTTGFGTPGAICGTQLSFTPNAPGDYILGATMEIVDGGSGNGEDVNVLTDFDGTTFHRSSSKQVAGPHAGNVVMGYRRWFRAPNLDSETTYTLHMELDGVASGGNYFARRVRYYAFRADSFYAVLHSLSTSGLQITAVPSGPTDLPGASISLSGIGLDQPVPVIAVFEGECQSNMFYQCHIEVDDGSTVEELGHCGTEAIDSGAGATDDVMEMTCQACFLADDAAPPTFTAQLETVSTFGNITTLGRTTGNTADLEQDLMVIVLAEPDTAQDAGVDMAQPAPTLDVSATTSQDAPVSMDQAPPALSLSAGVSGDAVLDMAQSPPDLSVDTTTTQDAAVEMTQPSPELSISMTTVLSALLALSAPNPTMALSAGPPSSVIPRVRLPGSTTFLAAPRFWGRRGYFSSQLEGQFWSATHGTVGDFLLVYRQNLDLIDPRDFFSGFDSHTIVEVALTPGGSLTPSEVMTATISALASAGISASDGGADPEFPNACRFLVLSNVTDIVIHTSGDTTDNTRAGMRGAQRDDLASHQNGATGAEATTQHLGQLGQTGRVWGAYAFGRTDVALVPELAVYTGPAFSESPSALTRVHRSTGVTADSHRFSFGLQAPSVEVAGTDEVWISASHSGAGQGFRFILHSVGQGRGNFPTGQNALQDTTTDPDTAFDGPTYTPVVDNSFAIYVASGVLVEHTPYRTDGSIRLRFGAQNPDPTHGSPTTVGPGTLDDEATFHILDMSGVAPPTLEILEFGRSVVDIDAGEDQRWGVYGPWGTDSFPGPPAVAPPLIGTDQLMFLDAVAGATPSPSFVSRALSPTVDIGSAIVGGTRWIAFGNNFGTKAPLTPGQDNTSITINVWLASGNRYTTYWIGDGDIGDPDDESILWHDYDYSACELGRTGESTEYRVRQLEGNTDFPYADVTESFPDPFPTQGPSHPFAIPHDQYILESPGFADASIVSNSAAVSMVAAAASLAIAVNGVQDAPVAMTQVAPQVSLAATTQQDAPISMAQGVPTLALAAVTSQDAPIGMVQPGTTLSIAAAAAANLAGLAMTQPTPGLQLGLSVSSSVSIGMTQPAPAIAVDLSISQSAAIAMSQPAPGLSIATGISQNATIGMTLSTPGLALTMLVGDETELGVFAAFLRSTKSPFKTRRPRGPYET